VANFKALKKKINEIVIESSFSILMLENSFSNGKDFGLPCLILLTVQEHIGQAFESGLQDSSS
jgi:hypothetical protein